MEDLNNHQIVLLTMFVSFVVSIATGIVTVAMLQEAPQTLTQTVNRVVEHTIERVVTGTSSAPVPATVTNVTKEVTVYAKEDDLVVSAVEKNQPRIVQIFNSTSGTTSDPVAIGFVASRDGLIVSDKTGLINEAGAMDEHYPVLIDGKEYSAVPNAKPDENVPIVFLKIEGLKDGDSLNAVTFGRTDDPKLGQTVVVLGGSDGTGIFKTTLSRFHFSKNESTSTPQVLTTIEALPAIPTGNASGLTVNLDGQAVGIVIPDPQNAERALIYPVSRILELVGASPAQAPNPATHAYNAGDQNPAG